MVKDQRAHPRHAVDLTVDCSTQDAFVSNRVTNLSRGGVFVRSDDPLPVGTEVALTLTLSGTGTTIRACGRVIWNYDVEKASSRMVRGMGIKLLDMGTDDRRKLLEYIGSLRPEDTLPSRPIASVPAHAVGDD
jgi:type IV pilus assembly protein PilZ